MKVGHTGRTRGRHAHQPMAEINIIPLVDVTLVLLIIFMATTAFVKEAGLQMTLPSAKSAQPQTEVPKDITVALTRDDKLYLDGVLTPPGQVEAIFQDRAAKSAATKTSTKVIVKGDESIPYRRVVQVIDFANQAGLPVTLTANLMGEEREVGK